MIKGEMEKEILSLPPPQVAARRAQDLSDCGAAAMLRALLLLPCQDPARGTPKGQKRAEGQRQRWCWDTLR